MIADREGVVRRAFLGSTTATDLWAAVAELHGPGSTPEPDVGARSVRHNNEVSRSLTSVDPAGGGRIARPSTRAGLNRSPDGVREKGPPPAGDD